MERGASFVVTLPLSRPCAKLRESLQAIRYSVGDRLHENITPLAFVGRGKKTTISWRKKRSIQVEAWIQGA